MVLRSDRGIPCDMDRAQRVRWGILGVGNISRQMIPAFLEAKNAALVAVASRSWAKARELAREARIPRAFGSYDELLADETVDAVYVALPNSLHLEWTLKAA